MFKQCSDGKRFFGGVINNLASPSLCLRLTESKQSRLKSARNRISRDLTSREIGPEYA